ncbi:hypothetical protein KSP39_PZI008527 [Platanthera zijinensis]|uniref:Uncharacterized protein n=1 Tax=Platanthera zijinensis TaxID=2320716 RepID=A0AAP0G967_9ASPA
MSAPPLHSFFTAFPISIPRESRRLYGVPTSLLPPQGLSSGWSPTPPSTPSDLLIADGVLLPLQLLSLPCGECPPLPHSNPPGPPAEPTPPSSTHSHLGKSSPVLQLRRVGGWCKRSKREIVDPVCLRRQRKQWY